MSAVVRNRDEEQWVQERKTDKEKHARNTKPQLDLFACARKHEIHTK